MINKDNKLMKQNPLSMLVKSGATFMGKATQGEDTSIL